MVLRRRDDEQPDEARYELEARTLSPEQSEQVRTERPSVLHLPQENVDRPADMQGMNRMPQRPTDDTSERFLNSEEAEDFRSRWQNIRTQFVDDPQDAVSLAGSLTSDIVTRITQRVDDERQELERAWRQGDKLTTEDRRLILQRYRTFFDRLLAS